MTIFHLRKNSCGSLPMKMCTSSPPLENIDAFFSVCFQVRFTENKRFVSSLLRCIIFSSFLIANLHRGP